jgi:hypothetical protein
MAISATGFSASSVASLYASQGDRVATALRRPAETLSREVEGARVRLSAFGQVQSAVAGVQSAANKLQDIKPTESVADVRKAAETFVTAFNNQRSALQRVPGSENGRNETAAVAQDGRAQVASSQLQRTVGDNSASLRDAGIRIQQDGSLTIDATALEAAYSANPTKLTQTLGSIGRAAEATATRQLSSTGSVGSAVSNLNSRVQQLETRQADVQTRIDESQRAVESASRRYGVGASGPGAYLGIFGL